MRKSITEVVVSHRPDRRTSGALHDETYYGRMPGTSGRVVVRKPVHSLGNKELDAIVDPAVRAAVLAKAKEVGDVKKLAHDPPVLLSRRGKPVPIRKVRIAKQERAVKIAKGPRERLVIEGSNHHIEILAELDAQGKETRWVGRVVSLLEANRRLTARPGREVVDRTCEPGQRFKFSLCRGDMLVLGEGEQERLWLVQKISVQQTGHTRVDLKPPSDARPAKEIPTQGRIHSPNTLRKAGARKVTVDALGAVRSAGD